MFSLLSGIVCNVIALQSEAAHGETAQMVVKLLCETLSVDVRNHLDMVVQKLQEAKVGFSFPKRIGNADLLCLPCFESV